MDVTRGLRIPILGLGCGGGGATAVERELAAIDGVVRVYVNPATETAYLDRDPAETDTRKIVQVIEEPGYHAGHPVEA